jgi:hypothetical protein
MKKLTMCLCALAIFVVVACNPQATSSENTSASGSQVAAETPAPAQEPGKSFTYNFDQDPAGGLPAKFHSALTGSGAPGVWAITADASAPSQPNVLAQTSADKTSYRFPLAIADEGSFRDLDLRDANNYYIVRANALEGNVVLYKVQSGKRTDLPVKGEGRTYGKKASVPSGQWNELRVTAAGSLFEVYLNNQKLYEVEDNTFPESGKVGLWTKADSVTHFDDLHVTAK